MLVFAKNHMTDRHHAAQWKGLNQLRKEHENISRGMIQMKGNKLAANQAALLPVEAYRDIDDTTHKVYQNDEGRGYMTSLMSIAKGVHIGKTASLYRNASDKSGSVNRSVSGQMPATLSKTVYEYGGDPVPVFTTGYGREWREGEAFSSEGFDEMIDDQENSSRDIMEDQALYMLWGDTGINIKGYVGYGICTHPNTVKLDLGGSGSNIDLRTATADEIVAYFTGDFANALDNNYTPRVDELWVSPQIMRNFEKPYSGATAFKEGTVKEYLERYGRIGSIQSTFELGRAGNGTGIYNDPTTGNEFFCFVKQQTVLCPIVGAAVSTVAIPRMMPMDDNNTLLWGAMGMRIRADSNGRSKVFYASEIT